MHVNVHLEIPLGISGYATVILTWVLIVASIFNLSQLQRLMVNEIEQGYPGIFHEIVDLSAYTGYQHT